MKILRFLQLDFLPRNVDAGLLLLRLWLGLSLVILHGWSKLAGFSKMSDKFPDPLGVGSTTSLALAVFAEVVCALLVATGLFARGAAAVLVINMATAFLLVHKAVLKGPNNGELAFVYLAGFLVILVAGPGRFSLDAQLTAGRGK